MGFLKVKANFMILVIVMSIFSIYLIKDAQLVEAVPNNVCCERSVGGSFCVYTHPSECDTNYNQASTTCEQTSFCKPSCCIDNLNGVCYPNVGVAQCASQSGTVVDPNDPLCRTNTLCDRGCCQIGNQCFLSTEKSCINRASSYPDVDTEGIWDDGISDEYACIEECTMQDEGCCVDLQTGCKWTTKEQCSFGSGGGFYDGVYCSDDSINCGCLPHFRKGCIGGEEDAYWFDSCGNPEDIAEDCDYSSGTLCMEGDGTASCESVNCETTALVPNNPHDPRIGGFRNNGESWCTYESGTGGFFDRPGSRHYRHVCVNGRELVEECKDYREEICIQADAEAGGLAISTAQCKRLDDFPKIDLEKYQETKDIGLSTVLPGTPGFNDNDKVLISSTTVDKGARFWEGENTDRCSEAGTIDCNVIWAKKSVFDDWDCEANCECETPEFIEQANNYCRMFGDCGADVNVLEKGTEDGLSVSWKGTGKGQHPTSLPEDAFSRLIVYGIYGGMASLRDSFSKSASNEFLANVISTAGILHVTWNAVMIAIVVAQQGTAAFVPAMNSLMGALGMSGLSGWIILAILIVLELFFGDEIGELLADLMGYDTKEKTITIECGPWVAPHGGDDCEKCVGDVRYDAETYDNPVSCSEYRCKSLGTACELINVGTTEQGCVSQHPNDVSPPLITPWQEILSNEYTIYPTGTGYLIQPDVQYWERFSFGIKTDEYAQCKWSGMHTNTYEEMISFFGTNLYTYNHNITVGLPGGEDYTYYVRCMDAQGNANINEHTIQFSTTNEPDLTPPVIESTSIANGAYLSNNVTKTPLYLNLNEPAVECRWNNENDIDFELMDGNRTFLCGNDLNDQFEDPNDPSTWSYSCVGLLTGINQGAGIKNLYYIRCKDLAGNAMQQGYPFNLIGSSPLKISGSGPEGIIYDKDASLYAMTSEGAQNGAATCSYRDSSSIGYINFFVTGGSMHQQQLVDLAPEEYNYDVYCRDVAGNSANDIITFIVDVDTYPPEITQIYASGGSVYIVTNEESTCSYSVDDKDFGFNDGVLFGVESVMHIINEESPVYYAKCKDRMDNLLSGVTIYV